MDIDRLIEEAGFFEGVSPESKRILAQVCLPAEYRRTAAIFFEGTPGDAMFLLVRGRIRLHKTSPDGHDIVIKVIKPGEVFAEIILFEEKHYPVTAVALTPVLVLKLLRRDLLGLLGRQDFRNDFITMLLRKQRYLAERIRELTSQDVEERLRGFLREQYGECEIITPEINKKQLAAAVGATPETLSRLLQNLRRAKQLVWRGKTIRTTRDFWLG